MPKHNDQLMEHEHCFSSHPRNRGHGEILDQQREEGAGNFILSSVNSNEENQQHKEDGNAELGMDFAGLFLADFSGVSKISDIHNPLHLLFTPQLLLV